MLPGCVGVPSGGCSEQGGCWGARGEPPAALKQRSLAHAIVMSNGQQGRVARPPPRTFRVVLHGAGLSRAFGQPQRLFQYSRYRCQRCCIHSAASARLRFPAPAMGCAQSVHDAEVRRERLADSAAGGRASKVPTNHSPPLLAQAATAATALEPSARGPQPAPHPHGLNKSPEQRFGDELYEKALAAVYANKALPPGGPPSAELEGRRIHVGTAEAGWLWALRPRHGLLSASQTRAPSQAKGSCCCCCRPILPPPPRRCMRCTPSSPLSWMPG